MEDMILEACCDGLRAAGYGTVEFNPGGVYVEAGGKAYVVLVLKTEETE